MNVLRRIIGIVIVNLMRIVSIFYNYQMSQRLKGYRNVLYTAWIRNFMDKVDSNVSIHYPCLIQGGGEKGISIGEGTCLQGHNVLGCWAKYQEQVFTPTLTIGRECNIGEYTHITACNKIMIGDGLLTGRFVYIGDNAHGSLSWEEADIPPVKRHLQSKGEIIIGNNVWIGDKVTILGGVTIGDNVIIGAGSIVTHDVPSNCMAAGMPANVIKQLDEK